jgi:hypothetical protein
LIKGYRVKPILFIQSLLPDNGMDTFYFHQFKDKVVKVASVVYVKINGAFENPVMTVDMYRTHIHILVIAYHFGQLADDTETVNTCDLYQCYVRKYFLRLPLCRDYPVAVA